jgi:nucleotide-binding universal stress UspA family protein
MIMRKIQSVLVSVDFSEASRAALDYAAALSERLGASVTALYVSPQHASYDQLPAFPPRAPIDPAQRQSLEDDLRRFVEPARREQGVPRVVVREGDPAEEILAQAGDSDADLIVLGTHGRRGFERWGLGSVTDRVTRRADRPVLAVPPHLGRHPTVRVLCALDLSDSSADTLEYAATFAQVMTGRLMVVHVAEGTHWYEPWPASGVDWEAIRRSVADAARESLSELVAGHVPEGVPVEVSVTFGRPQREIERIAGEAADLVVLGVPSTHGVDRLFFGSTAQHVLRAGVCPVLLMRRPLAGSHAPDPEERNAAS